MQIKMTQSAFGSANESGNETKEYAKDEIIDCTKPWQITLAKVFLDEGFAVETKTAKPETTAKKKTAKKKATKKK